MRIKFSDRGLRFFFSGLDSYVTANHPLLATRYVRLGSKVMRISIRDAAFLPQVERQFTWALVDNPEKYDATLVVWREPDIGSVPKRLFRKDLHILSRMRIESLVQKRKVADFDIMNDAYSAVNPVAFFHDERGYIEAADRENSVYYYGVREPSPENLIREGHLFVQFVNQTVKTPSTGLVHGACVGMNGNGVLLCGIGHRGKSTLTVLSMVRGMEYVSDDYQILEKEPDGLFAYPFYSIITLSEQMYSDMYDEFDGKFVSMNARKDKYVFNIAAYHDRFRSRYPVKACVFPEIVSDPEPSIVPCTPEERNRAIAQLVGSTVRQMRDLYDSATSRKLMDMVKDFPFWKINLCRDLGRNVEALKAFCENIDKR